MSSNSPATITTIIPTFRRPVLLKRAILSALSQGGGEIRVCVYDNASGDETAETVAAIRAGDARVDYHCHSTNIGAFANFQYGLERVRTPFFSFLSDDDYLLPDFYRQAIASLEGNPRAMFWSGLTVRVEPDGTVFDARLDHWEREGEYLPPEGVLAMLGKNAPCWTATLFRTEILASVGLLDREVGDPSDLDFMIRAASRYPYVLSKHPSAVFTMNPAGTSETAPFSNFWPGWLKMIDNVRMVRELSAEDREMICARLHADARSMLLRRGAAALAKRNRVLPAEAAGALRTYYGARKKALLLELLVRVCAKVPLVQWAYTASYRAAERMILMRRRTLRSRYAQFVPSEGLQDR